MDTIKKFNYVSNLKSLQELITLGGGLSTGDTNVNGGIPNDYTTVVNELNSNASDYYNKFNSEGVLVDTTGTWGLSSTNTLFGKQVYYDRAGEFCFYIIYYDNGVWTYNSQCFLESLL